MHLRFELSRLATILTTGLALATSTSAQGWILRNPTTSPPPRLTYGLMTYDFVRGQTVLFGGFGLFNGSGGGTDLGDTWEYDGTNWQQSTPANSPSARRYGALAFHASTGRVVLFGGMDSTGLLNDTWEYDGTNWTLATPLTSPQPRWIHTMTYDLLRNRVVLFGGRGGSGDTWEWDGSDWILQLPVTNPLNRDSHAMAYDSSRGVVVMFGGDIGGRSYVDETWEWDGTDWTLRTSASSPGPRRAMAMSYNTARGTVMLFEGEEQSFANRTDTWEWDGTDWSLVHAVSGPQPRRYHNMVYDVLRSRLVSFGGNNSNNVHLDDTWEWAADAATASSYGAGCGPVPPTLMANARPVVGTTVQLDTNDVPAGTVIVGMVFSLTKFDPGISLTSQGLTGCEAYTGGDVAVVILPSGNTASRPFTVPNDPAFMGLHVYSQSVTATPGVNPFGALTSNGLDLGIGLQ